MNLRQSKERLIPYVNLALCILLWASIPVATKKILTELNNLQTLFYSTVLSTMVLAVLVLLQKKAEGFRQYDRKQYTVMFCLGLLGNYLYYIFLYGALSRTTASEGFVLAYTWPIMVLVLSFLLLKERITIQKIMGILISFVGIVIITTRGNIAELSLTNLQGDILALVGAFIFALFSVLGKKYNFDKTISVFVYFLSALIAIIPTVAVFSEFVLPSPKVWPWVIYNGILVNGISYIFWFKALETGKTHLISNLLYLTPFISLIYISFFLEEKIPASAVLGFAVIVSGVSSQYIRGRSSREKKQ